MIKKNLKKRIFTSLILLIFTIAAFYSNFAIIYMMVILGVMSIIEFLNITNKIFKNIFYKYLINFFFILYISLFLIIFFYFSQFFKLKILLFSFLFTCIASDIGGYVVGKFFGGPKLTKLSPKKTISGSIGSLIFASLVFVLLIYYINGTVSFKFVISGFIISLVCQIGDLFFSFLKRKAKLKDTGNLFPGHGGVLDRLDGILLGIPFGLIVTLLLF